MFMYYKINASQIKFSCSYCNRTGLTTLINQKSKVAHFSCPSCGFELNKTILEKDLTKSPKCGIIIV